MGDWQASQLLSGMRMAVWPFSPIPSRADCACMNRLRQAAGGARLWIFPECTVGDPQWCLMQMGRLKSSWSELTTVQLTICVRQRPASCSALGKASAALCFRRLPRLQIRRETWSYSAPDRMSPSGLISATIKDHGLVGTASVAASILANFSSFKMMFKHRHAPGAEHLFPDQKAQTQESTCGSDLMFFDKLRDCINALRCWPGLSMQSSVTTNPHQV